MALINLKCVSVLLQCSTVKLFPTVGTDYCLFQKGTADSEVAWSGQLQRLMVY